LAGSLVIWDLLNVATLVTSTAIMGKSVAIAMMPAAAGTFFWAAVRGDNIPAVATATVVADATVGIGTASGTMTGTIVAGKAVNNAKGVVASAGTRTFANAQTTNGSPIITVQDASGLYIGVTLSGTGVGAGTVTAIAADNRTVTNSANSTATGSITLTATNTGFIIVQCDRPFAQGPIT
jgi:hypothetical protein